MPVTQCALYSMHGAMPAESIWKPSITFYPEQINKYVGSNGLYKYTKSISDAFTKWFQITLVLVLLRGAYRTCPGSNESADGKGTCPFLPLFSTFDHRHCRPLPEMREVSTNLSNNIRSPWSLRGLKFIRYILRRASSIGMELPFSLSRCKIPSNAGTSLKLK